MKFTLSNYLSVFREVFRSVNQDDLDIFVETIESAIDRGATIHIFGNGGSFANSMHFCNDLQGFLVELRKIGRVMAVGANGAMFSAFSNDYGYEMAVQKYLEITAREGDVLVAISCSGKSPNIINSVNYARNNGLITLAVSTTYGETLTGISDCALSVDTNDAATAESAHTLLLDYVVKTVRASLKQTIEAD